MKLIRILLSLCTISTLSLFPMLSTLKNEQFLHEKLNDCELTLQKHALPIENIEALDQIRSVTYSPNGAHCIIGKALTCNELIQSKGWNNVIYTLWDTKNHTGIAQFNKEPRFSPCNKYLIFSKEQEKKIILFDLTTHKISAIELPNKLTCFDAVTMSPDGKYIATHSVLERRNITVWHRKDSESIIQLPVNKHLCAIKAAIAFHKNYMFFANRKNNDISFYNLTTPEAEPIIVASNCENPHLLYSSIFKLIINKNGSYMMAKCNDELIKLFNISDLTNVIDITDAIDTHSTYDTQFIGDTNWIAYTKFFPDDYPLGNRLRLFNSDTRIVIPYDIPCYNTLNSMTYDHDNHRLIVKSKKDTLCCINLPKLASKFDEKALIDYEILPLEKPSTLVRARVNNNGFLVCDHAKAVILCDTYGNELAKIDKISDNFTPINPIDNNIILAAVSHGNYKLIQWEWDYKPIDKAKNEKHSK